MKKNNIYILSILLLLSLSGNAQLVFVKQIGSVAFRSNTIDKDSLRKTSYATLCNSYINKYYPKNKLPLVYLVVNPNNDSLLYELAFDNLNGNSLSNKLYNRKSKYDIPGIRIVICSSNMQSEICLKLLDYAINNLSTLKSIRKQALKKDYYDQPNTLSLNRVIIDSIINTRSKIKSNVSN
jgi:hypothetical protein